MPTPTRTGYTLAGWFTGMGGAGTQITATTVWNYTTNLTVYAHWTANTYTLTLNPSTGTCGTSSIQVTYDQAILSMPTATQPNCIFVGWFIGTQQIAAGYVWNYTSNQAATAIFEYPIVASVNNTALGTINPTGTINYNLGNNANYVCTPNSNAYIVSVIVDGTTVFTGTNGTTAPYTHSFTNINAYHTIVVNFAVNCYPRNPGDIIPAGVTVSMNPAGCVPYDSPVTFSFAANCVEITNVLIDGAPQGIISSYTIPNVTGPLPIIEVLVNPITYTITATPGLGVNLMGYITPSGAHPAPCGEDVTFNFITELGYRVSTLYVDGASVPVPVSKSYTFKNVKGNHSIEIEFEEFPYYIIQFGPDASQNAGGAVYPFDFPTTQYFIAADSASDMKFSIVPAFGFVIDQVIVDGFNNALAVQTGTHTFTNLHGNHTIYATFKPKMFTINATGTAGGMLMPNGAVPVAQGDNQPFLVMPNDGYHIVDVSVDGVSQGVTGSYLFTNVMANHTIHAIFAINTYTITPTAGANGTILPNTVQTVDHGANRTFNFSPATGYKVDKVYIDGNEDVAAAIAGTYTFYNVIANHVIHVTFTKQVYTITSAAGPNGEVTPLGVEFVEYWAHSEIYVFDPAPGYHIKQVLIDGVNDPLAVFNAMHRFLNVDANHTIVVFFAKNEYTITATATAGGAINPPGLVTVPNGQDKTFFFDPNAGYKLVRVIVDGIDQPDAVATGLYTFYDVSDNHTISAQFEKSGYEVFLPAVEGAYVIPMYGSISPVNYNGKFTFVVELLPGYTQSNIEVRTNGIVITPVGSDYIINNITVDQHVTITGIKLNTYLIKAKAENGGEIQPAGEFSITHGDSKIFQLIPKDGFKIDDVKVNGESEGALEFYTLIAKADATVVAYFKYNVDIPENEEAIITVFSNHNKVTIDNKDLVPVKQVEIMDMFGRVVWQGQTTGVKTEITLEVAAGIYAVRILTESGFATTKVSITK
jgi:uncharacterized repeat protein (TIGR02543 family)